MAVLSRAARCALVATEYFFARHFAAGLFYWFDKYNVEDFALSPSTIIQINMPERFPGKMTRSCDSTLAINHIAPKSHPVIPWSQSSADASRRSGSQQAS